MSGSPPLFPFVTDVRRDFIAGISLRKSGIANAAERAGGNRDGGENSPTKSGFDRNLLPEYS
jgi:hypothetical protein